VITPDSPDRQYSTRLRTALVLTGSGTAGAYHAGVLRALHEAGVRIDLVAGRGAWARSARLLTAVDGGARLWDADGVWRSPSATAFYGWRTPLRLAGWALLAAAGVFLLPLALLARPCSSGCRPADHARRLRGGRRAPLGGVQHWIATLFAPEALPTVVPRLALFALLVAVAILAGRAVARTFRCAGIAAAAGWGSWPAGGAPLSAASLAQRRRPNCGT
jgi:hypothetical protein